MEIDHKWNGLKTLFTTADKYHVFISDSVTGKNRIALFSLACVFDLILGDQ
jgi:hypothetical protein